MADISKSLVEQVREAADRASPLEIRGGGSKGDLLGRQISGDILDVSGHTGILYHDPTELVLTARAGTRLSEIEQVLQEHGQFLSFEPPHFGKTATIGATLAGNLSGPGRPWGGSVRDMVLGVRLINGRGEYLRFGGQVMKNVAGYDLARLQAGALGVLGVLTEVSLKVLPAPERSLTLFWEMKQGEGIEKMNRLAAIPSPLSGAVWVDNVLYVRLAGTAAALATVVRDWGGREYDEGERFWRDIREQTHSFFAGTEPLWRFAVRSDAPPMFDPEDMLLDWGGGVRWLRGHHAMEELADHAAKQGGHVILFSGGSRKGRVRPDLHEPQKKLHKRLKKAFDPVGILNPGRLYEWM